ncbi:LPXTG cell wall anchor domain-containing protein [Actinophytocola algeriensis]|nr:LPXTG cell wall anchor domain-containing protein [Actinophytocola algeriensis]MBE1478379.1 LPXTG-motif cell wall-anchored protein [Actinophytocola algeriensis]
MTARGGALRDGWGIAGTFPAGLTVTGSTGLAAVETGKGTLKGFGEDKLDPGATATVTVTFRADAETSGPVTFRVFGGLWPDVNPDNDTVARDVVVAKATAPAPPKPAPQPKLADTGASSAVPLLAGGVLVLLGGGLLLAVRRGNSRGNT